MNLESIHKYVNITPTANGSSVTIAGQQAITISKMTSVEGKEQYCWAINPVFARMTYSASSFTDIPYCRDCQDSEHLAIAEAIVAIMELGAFKTSVELPEDTYAATMVQESVDAVEREISSLISAASSNLFERIENRKKVTNPLPLSEERVFEIMTAVSEGTVSPKDKLDIYISLASGQLDFVAEDNLTVVSTVAREPIIVEVAEEPTESTLEAVKTESEPLSILKEFQARKTALNESMRLLSTHTSSDGKKTAKVYKDSEWGEHRVKHYVDGKHQTEADYHTDDKEDAVGTAKKFVAEGKESEYSANSALSDTAKTTVPQRKVRIIGPSKGTVSKHDTVAQARAHFSNQGYSSKKGYSIQEELEDGTFKTVIFEDDDAAYEKWVSDVKKKHGDKKIKFKGRVESGCHTTSAEVPGEDRSYAVYDHDKNKGHVFEEAEDITFDSEDVEIVAEEKNVFEFVGMFTKESGFKVKG